MKVVVFGTTNWDSKAQVDYLRPSLKEWKNRVNYFCGDPEMFISSGTYSDPKLNPLSIPLVQNGVQKTRPYCKEWNYFRNGFITGCWHSLLNMEFDVLVHVQCRTLLGTDLMSMLHRFNDSVNQIMAPRYVSISRNISNSVEVGMMAMKPDAVKTFTSFGIRPSLSPYEQINCEEEALELFSTSWFNPFPAISSCRKRESGFGEDGPDDISKEEFLKLPLIAAQKHASEKDVLDWCKRHPYDIKGGLI
jgi:hypothetical protein|tara:strand:+ start:756 stop:1499 length:744 start_codon:yes stop_codon:yes gene_type:complete